MRHLLSLLLVLTLFACDKEKFFDGPDSYSDDFSDYTEIDDLIDGNDERWSFFQKTYEENTLSIDTVIYHSAGKSFKSFGMPADERGASKASINKQFMAFWTGETVGIEAWYYIEGDAPAEWLFLFDLEEKVAIGAGPGMRLALVNNQLRVEHKYPKPDIIQDVNTALDFPRNEWVKIRFEAKLSQKEEGTVRLWQNDVLIIEQTNWQTLPKDILYANQGTKGMYSQIEFGVTANASSDSITVYVDDIAVGLVE